jgi:hypothetical protein
MDRRLSNFEPKIATLVSNFKSEHLRRPSFKFRETLQFTRNDFTKKTSQTGYEMRTKIYTIDLINCFVFIYKHIAYVFTQIIILLSMLMRSFN